jgi:hypothetical protein
VSLILSRAEAALLLAVLEGRQIYDLKAQRLVLGVISQRIRKALTLEGGQ